MPLFYFVCEDCQHVAEHFIYHASTEEEKELKCPKCESNRYEKQVSRFRLNVEYADNAEWMANKVEPHVSEAYEKIGREALSEDTRTLENLFGEEKVDKTFYKKSD